MIRKVFNNEFVENINLWSRNIGDIGAIIIACGLKHATSLICLNLGKCILMSIGCCRITDEGIIALGEALVDHKNLARLLLGKVI